MKLVILLYNYNKVTKINYVVGNYKLNNEINYNIKNQFHVKLYDGKYCYSVNLLG